MNPKAKGPYCADVRLNCFLRHLLQSFSTARRATTRSERLSRIDSWHQLLILIVPFSLFPAASARCGEAGYLGRILPDEIQHRQSRLGHRLPCRRFLRRVRRSSRGDCRRRPLPAREAAQQRECKAPDNPAVFVMFWLAAVRPGAAASTF